MCKQVIYFQGYQDLFPNSIVHSYEYVLDNVKKFRVNKLSLARNIVAKKNLLLQCVCLIH